MPASTVTLETIISLCKRKGFVYQSSELYGGLNGLYDFGHLGTLLRQNIKNAWLESIYRAHDSILLFEGSLLSPASVWEASGHVQNFHDPMVDCLNCAKRYRTDEISLEKACPSCGRKEWTDVRTFNMMFKTQVGATQDHAASSYLRPETAQSIFVNFKNVYSTNRVKIPFGIAQIGKAFRNEINPKHFLFRMREFEQMELEWFCRPDQAQQFFEFWRQERLRFHQSIGIKIEKLRLREYEKEELSHYSKATCDIEYQFPFGWKELEGIAHRGDFDLSQHTRHSGKELAVFDEVTKESYIPNVIESSVGLDRLFLTLFFDCYEEQLVGEEKRTVLHFAPHIAPIKAAFFPLDKTLKEPTLGLFEKMKKRGYYVEFDDVGSIGKRYRRQDEIGTPLCFTYDFESSSSNSITVRHRDTMQQERISLDNVKFYLEEFLEKRNNRYECD